MVTVKGKLDISRVGMGFVSVEGMKEDILIRPNDLNKALQDDIVRVQINKDPGRGKRIEGKITEVVERGHTTYVGNIHTNGPVSFFVAATEKVMPDFSRRAAICSKMR